MTATEWPAKPATYTQSMDELERVLVARDEPPICPRCGVTMVPAALSADDSHEGEWVCLECEELDEQD